MIGVALGLGGALLVKKMVGAEILISMQSIVLAFSVAASVGVFFGYYNKEKLLENGDKWEKELAHNIRVDKSFRCHFGKDALNKRLGKREIFRVIYCYPVQLG